ncbi:hypothetical protein RUM44_011796 [Polyplax serrata]|uniref:Codanin-1 C-terminal domain-containing protein n=1 Tax=Polyplax serrata TaxID=468196 RepID=A0ABR1ARP8_POLSC
MAAREILSDVLNNFLPSDSLLEWLSNDTPIKHVVFDAETPRKTPCSRKLNNSTTGKSSQPVHLSHNSSQFENTYLDLESLQSFPNLSSCSSVNLGSTDKKRLESTPNNVGLEQCSKENSEKKTLRRVKLFSETLETSSKQSGAPPKEMEFSSDFDNRSENKFTVSTPKSLNTQSHLSVDCFNILNVTEASPKQTVKLQWVNQTFDVQSTENAFVAPKSKSFSGNSSLKNKDNKTGGRMSLGDFILNDLHATENRKEKKSKTKKRVNPMRISSQTSVNEKTDDFSLITLHEHVGVVPTNENQSDNTCGGSNPDENKQDSRPAESSIKRQPELDEATFTHELKLLAKIYSFLISENFCQNIMMELCFIVSLLVIQDCDRKISESDFNFNDKKFFSSIHNCVYFAVEMLWLQRNCFILLNLSALKLLSENDRIKKFNCNLKEFLVSAYTQKQSTEDMKRCRGLSKTSMQGNVSFQYETDNRENFTSDFSFHCFRKQRDLFYNILAIWEANHLVSGWIFSVGLGSKIRSLLSISSDPINLLHLARLFRNQLITSCCGENHQEEDLNEKILQLLPTADPNKILRLRARLTSSPKRQGPCPLPDFTGHQEFYKDFILHTGHTAFHEHLKNSFCDEILRLNDTDLVENIEDEDISLDEQIEESYLQCTNILRLLAKFLGFLEFMPYRGEKSFSDRILNMHCSVRNNLPSFPNEKFYAVLDDFNEASPGEPDVTMKNYVMTRKHGLDSYRFIEYSHLYALCPYLNEINVILSENLGCNVRHIRPVTTQESSSSKLQASKQLELRLEGNFLQNQSSSTRKTVEFVTERVASITIKHLVHTVIPAIKASAWVEIENLPVDNPKETDLAAENRSEPLYKQLLSACEKENWEICLKRSNIAMNALLSSDLHGSVVDTCAKIVARQSVEKVERWMQSHLTLAMVKKELVSIMRKKNFKKTTDASMHESELTGAVFKNKYQVSSDKTVEDHHGAAWPASKSIKAVRELICCFREVEVDARQVLSLIKEAAKTVKQRKDTIPAAEKTLISLTLDLVVIFCIHSKSSDLGKVFEQFSELFNSSQAEKNSHCNLERIICARNLAIISRAGNKEIAWENIGKFLFFLLKGNFLAKEHLEAQLLSLFRHNYNKDEEEQFLKLISQLLSKYTMHYGRDKFSLLLEFMRETLEEDELKSDGLS